MVDSILVPMDGSSDSKAGLEHALTEYPDADITVVHVIAPPKAWGHAPSQETIHEWYERLQERSEDIFEDARQLAASHDTDLETRLEVGEPWRVIVSYAEDHAVDLIVMGSRGRTEDSSLPLGSVAETVLRRSPVVVSIVR